MSDYTFRKAERLSGRKVISTLYETGNSFHVFPCRFIYGISREESFPVQVAISVPKRLFRNAVDRNLLKRRIREAYRQNKHLLYEPLAGKGVTLQLIIQYHHKEIVDFHTLEKGLKKGMIRLLADNGPATQTDG